MSRDEMITAVKSVFRQFGMTGMRLAYLVNLVLIILGFVVNHYLPHGWVAWPAVLAVGILVLMNEAVDRNGQGIPPLVVYAWFAIVLAGWFALAVIFSAIAPILFFVGIPTAAVFGLVSWRREKKRRKLVDTRRADGQCIHCGEPVEKAMGACGNCGREVDQDDSLLARIRSLAANRSKEDTERTREILTPAAPTIAAMRKERALLDRKRKRGSSTTPPSSQPRSANPPTPE